LPSSTVEEEAKENVSVQQPSPQTEEVAEVEKHSDAIDVQQTMIPEAVPEIKEI